MERLNEVLSGNEGHYLLPFLWMKGERKEKIRETLSHILQCGIRQVCVESRPHPDFLGEGWWRDLDAVMEFAQEKGMKVWILDDRKFPTGYANGAYEKRPEKAKLYLAEEHVDVLGPAAGAAVLLEPLLKQPEKILGIWMYPRVNPDTAELCLDRAEELSGSYQNGMVFADVPKGMYRVQVFYTTYSGPGKAHYVNLLDEASVQVLIEQVYEPHYQRYGERYRGVFAGFFSDEPELGNVEGCTFLELPGQPGKRLLWSGGLETHLKERWKDNYGKNLAALWYECGESTSQLRYDYMDEVSSQAGTAFAEKIGSWCREHGLAHIGHIIEDNNAHGGLGCSMGHYFRSQRGQAMSGVDVVSLQIMPGFTGKVHQWLAAETDGEFFHFGLAKLGASEAHLNPEKKGRAFCEIFGAYGWAEGVPLMRWLADHMLARGINHFVPHAFSMTFPDDDCPPHFYADGKNSQYPFFAELMQYMNRMCHLLNGGRSMAEALVVYHSEAAWGSRETMPFQKLARALMERQLDCDILPSLYFPQVGFKDNKIEINGKRYNVLLFPYSRWIPENFAVFACQAAARGILVYWMDKFPERIGDGREDLLGKLKGMCKCIPVESLADELIERGMANLGSSERLPFLRTFLYRQDDGIILFAFNEDPWNMAETDLSLFFIEGNGENEENGEEKISCYRAADNQEYLLSWYPQPDMPGWRRDGGIHLCLYPGEAACFVIERGKGKAEREKEESILTLRRKIKLDGSWSAAGKEAGQEKLVFSWKIQNERDFKNLNGPSGRPDFCGVCTYRTELEIERIEPGERWFLEIPKIYDCAEILINQKKAGMRYGRPYKLEVTKLLQTGRNSITINVSGTYVWKLHDRRSARMQLMPTGILCAPILQIWGAGGETVKGE